MPSKRILFISGSAGLGHVTRDLAITRELKRQIPGIELSWLAAPPANSLIEEAGEKLLPEANQWSDETLVGENLAKGFRLNLANWSMKFRDGRAKNVEIFNQVTSNKQFDLIIGDETYEIAIAMRKRPKLRKVPFLMIYDFIGFDSMTNNPIEKLIVYLQNRFWSMGYKRVPVRYKPFFVGELEDIPDQKFGFLLPNRREWAKERYEFLGYIVQFNPAEYIDKSKIRELLGYDEKPLIICAIGGTAVGQDLLKLCAQTYPIIREEIPDLRMILICGPRLSSQSLNVPQGVEIRGYIPELYKHFAACDLAIIQAGGTSSIELTALKIPFIYFPLEDHCEQQLYVAGRLARHKAGVKMQYSKTTPEILAEKIISNIGKKVAYPPIPTDGAKKAVQIISRLL